MKTNHKVKILHIITGLNTGGAETMLLKVLTNMDRESFLPEVVSLTDIGSVGPKIQELGIPVHAIGMRPEFPGPLSIWRFIRRVRGLQPDLLQGWMYHGNLAAQFTNAFLPNPVPVLWNVRHSIYDLKNEKKMTAWMIRLGAKFSNKPSRILYNSKISASQHEALGYVSEKRVTIPNGFDTDIFSSSEEARLKIRQELGLSASSSLIGLIGRYHPMKDHGNFVRAASYISKTHPDIHFVLAGTDVDCKNTELTDLVKSQGLTSKFHLLGERNDINRLTASLDIASSSSFTEAFSNTIGEAMACEVPCVATNVGDSDWMVGDTGRLVPPRDPAALASACEDLLDIGLDGRKALGAKARERIINNFSINKIVSNYEALYSSLIN